MATNSIFHNVIINTEEAAERFVDALEKAEKWAIEHATQEEKLVEDDCSSMPCCDFCAFFDSASAFDEDGVNVARGLCFKHSKMVDPSGGCDDFYCQCCAKEKFCGTIRRDPVGERVCKGYFEDDEIHPMCVKCYQYVDKEC